MPDIPKVNYSDFFQTATSGAPEPYLWQCRLACGEPPEGANCELVNPDKKTKQWLSGPHPDGCQSRLIDIPTGLGKTAGVVLAWLWNYLQIQNSNSKIQNTGWPRRPGTVCPRYLETLLRAADGRASRQTSADKSPQEVNRTTLAE